MQNNQVLLKYHPWTEVIHQILLKCRQHIAKVCILHHQFQFHGFLYYFESKSLEPQHIAEKDMGKLGHPVYILFEEKNNQRQFHFV